MTHLQKSILASGIALALGSVGSAWANPTNYADKAEIKGDNHQTAYLNNTMGGNESPQANEFSEAWSEDHSHAKAEDNASAANNNSTAETDNSEAKAEDFGVAANNHGTATNSSHATADDAAANNHSAAYSDRSANAEDDAIAANNGADVDQDNSYADVHGTGAAANGGGNATYTDSHDTDNSYASSSGSYTAAANNHATAEVHMAIADSELHGTVTHNVTTFNNPIGLGAASYTANNSADGAVAGAAGVVNFSQNTGQNALTQQSVSTQASLTVE